MSSDTIAQGKKGRAGEFVINNAMTERTSHPQRLRLTRKNGLPIVWESLLKGYSRRRGTNYFDSYAQNSGQPAGGGRYAGARDFFPKGREEETGERWGWKSLSGSFRQ